VQGRLDLQVLVCALLMNDSAKVPYFQSRFRAHFCEIHHELGWTTHLRAPQHPVPRRAGLECLAGEEETPVDEYSLASYGAGMRESHSETGPVAP
jgi:hypothetical protein